MTSTTSHSIFESLPLPRKDVPQAEISNYRVYSDSKNFVMITALSALEALQSSAISSPYKIQRDSLDLTKVFDPKAWFNAAGEGKPLPSDPQAPAENAATAASTDPAAMTEQSPPAATPT
jgi:hypothetical protein